MNGEEDGEFYAVGFRPILRRASQAAGRGLPALPLGAVGGPPNIPTAGVVGGVGKGLPALPWGAGGGPPNMPTADGVGRRAEDCPPYLWGRFVRL